MGLRSNKADLKTLKNSFNQIDTDHDGSLSKEELEKAGALS
jgi:Ca2+-binding EF-hand superfamily protein|tara:strand:+ start:1224 stop:1346 length:123 start_codon:yes stop_codon:yes gene_type:complete